jgi:hypothetical protein
MDQWSTYAREYEQRRQVLLPPVINDPQSAGAHIAKEVAAGRTALLRYEIAGPRYGYFQIVVAPIDDTFCCFAIWNLRTSFAEDLTWLLPTMVLARRLRLHHSDIVPIVDLLVAVREHLLRELGRDPDRF